MYVKGARSIKCDYNRMYRGHKFVFNYSKKTFISYMNLK